MLEDHDLADNPTKPEPDSGVKENVAYSSKRVVNWLITIAIYGVGIGVSVWVSMRFLLSRYPANFVAFFDSVPGLRILLYLLPFLAIMVLVILFHDVFAKEKV